MAKVGLSQYRISPLVHNNFLPKFSYNLFSVDSAMNTSSPQYFAQVSRDLEPLLERYFSNRKKDIATIKELLESGKFEEIRNIGHTMKGTGASYGFQYITEIGKSFENAAKESDGISIEGQLYELEQYINTVKIEFIDE